ncbi:putative benzoate 4-monooxygenase cytochrome P450 [Xylariaceae sp. FL1272]|nr:putative benzoate 4-monooxygenase cytochrome P450 [Xylariaceae sp. FL1272]
MTYGWSATAPGALELIVLWLAFFLAHSLYNVYLHPLSQYPGPLLRSASSIPNIRGIWTGTSVRSIELLHKKYGPVVRTAPDALSFTTEKAWRGINSPKITSAYLQFPTPSQSSVNSNDEDHSRMRRLISHAFSQSALVKQLPLIVTHMKNFIYRVRDQCVASPEREVDLNTLFISLAFDVITDLSYGQSLEALKKTQPNPFIVGFYRDCQMYPIIPTVNEYSPLRFLFGLMMRVPAIKKGQEMAFRTTQETVLRRMKHGRRSGEDFMTYMLRHNHDRSMTEAEIIGSTSVFVNGGAEATATCMSAAIYFMLSNPTTYEQAREEVRSSFESQNNIESSTISHLVYLNALVEETLRIFPPTAETFARRTDAVSEIDGHVIPPGVSVGVHQWSANHSPQNFHAPDTFAPERWLSNCPPEYQNDSRGAMQPWSIGPRNCIGKK